ncbi:MAG: glutamyl-tRNA reductase [Saprospiraceae bacterium]|nr:glutamyl-tRNA reductase [Saprospiraceae bacterium]
MLSDLKILTVTHKSASLKEVGDFVIKPSDDFPLQSQLENLKEVVELKELLYIATCNRVIYFFVSKSDLSVSFTTRFFQYINSYLNENRIAVAVQSLEGSAAIAHLYEVAASIDSLVVGERQILGQLREAYDQCHAWGLTGDTIRLAFQQMVVAAKEVYARTRIGDKPVSVVSLAVRKMLSTHLPKDARILLIGAGQTNALVAKFLAKQEFTKVTVFNRSLQKAEELAKLLGGKANTLTNIFEYKEGFDCLFVCTGATDPIIQPELYKQLLQGETDTKIVIDLAIPHNVAPEVIENYNIQYIEIEGLRTLAQENLAFRETEVEKARQILANYVAEFPTLFKQRQLERAMSRVPEEIKAVKAKALSEVFRKDLEQLDASTRELLEKMLTYMEKKCIAVPMKVAREMVG